MGTEVAITRDNGIVFRSFIVLVKSENFSDIVVYKDIPEGSCIISSQAV